MRRIHHPGGLQPHPFTVRVSRDRVSVKFPKECRGSRSSRMLSHLITARSHSASALHIISIFLNWHQQCKVHCRYFQIATKNNIHCELSAHPQNSHFPAHSQEYRNIYSKGMAKTPQKKIYEKKGHRQREASDALILQYIISRHTEEEQIEETPQKPQWIVIQRLLSHLQ